MSFSGKSVVLLFVVLITLTSTGFATDENEITLDEAIQIALGNNPSLSSTQLSVDAAKADKSQVDAVLYPQVTLSSDLSVSSSNNSLTTRVSATQRVYDFGKTSSQLETADKNVALAEQNLQTARQVLIRDVRQAYFEVLKKQHLVSVALESLSDSKRQLEQAKALYKQGLRPRIDLTRGEVRVSQSRLSLSTANYNQRKALIAFKRLLGDQPEAEDYVLQEAELDADSLGSLESLLNAAIDQRDDLQALKTQVSLAEENLAYIESSGLPSISASAAINLNLGSSSSQASAWSLGVGLSWPLFTGYKHTHQVSESRIGIERARAQLNNKVLLIKEEVTQAYYQLIMAEETISNAETTLKQAKGNLDIAQGRYKAGISDAIELSDAGVLYSESKSSLVQAIYDRQKAIAQLEYVVGGSVIP